MIVSRWLGVILAMIYRVLEGVLVVVPKAPRGF